MTCKFAFNYQALMTLKRLAKPLVAFAAGILGILKTIAE